jgi:hypothetical protein
MKKKVKWVLYLVISVIIAVVIFFTLKTDIKISEVSWVLKGSKCIISFKADNNTQKNLKALIRIYIYSPTNLSPAAKTSVFNLIGSKQIEYELSPFSSRFFNETILVTNPEIVKIDVIANSIKSSSTSKIKEQFK